MLQVRLQRASVVRKKGNRYVYLYTYPCTEGNGECHVRNVEGKDEGNTKGKRRKKEIPGRVVDSLPFCQGRTVFSPLFVRPFCRDARALQYL